jgi:ribosome-binding protein aMBF1 (putative translation factor)
MPDISRQDTKTQRERKQNLATLRLCVKHFYLTFVRDFVNNRHTMKTQSMATKRKMKSDVLQFVYDRYIKGDPEQEASFENEVLNAKIAREIYDLRTKAGLSQRQLAKIVGTTASVICRLEDADYEGHSLSMLQRIAAALDSRVEIRIVPLRKTTRVKKAA